MSVEHNPNPLTDEEWERICNLGGSWSNTVDRSRLDCYRAAGITVEPPPVPPVRYGVQRTDHVGVITWRVVDYIYGDHSPIFHDEEDARTWADVLNGKAKIVYRGGGA